MTTKAEVIALQRTALDDAWNELHALREKDEKQAEALAAALEQVEEQAEEIRKLQSKLSDAEAERDQAQEEAGETEERAQNLEDKINALSCPTALCHDVLIEFGAAREPYPFAATSTAWQREIEQAIERSANHDDR